MQTMMARSSLDFQYKCCRVYKQSNVHLCTSVNWCEQGKLQQKNAHGNHGLFCEEKLLTKMQQDVQNCSASARIDGSDEYDSMSFA